MGRIDPFTVTDRRQFLMAGAEKIPQQFQMSTVDILWSIFSLDRHMVLSHYSLSTTIDAIPTVVVVHLARPPPHHPSTYLFSIGRALLF